MGQEEHQSVKNVCFLYHEDESFQHNWKIENVEESIEELDDDMSSSLSSFVGSTISNGSSSSDMDDDASSSPNSCLYDLSELISQLPIKKGLSKFYQGKSESFTSFAMVTSIEDLAKIQTPYKKKLIKPSKSYGGGLNSFKLYNLPKGTITKKSKSKSSIFSSSYNSQV